MHDIGNAADILKKIDLNIEERIRLVSVIGHHDEWSRGAANVISAVLNIAEKQGMG